MAIRTDGDGGHPCLRLRRRSQWKRGDRTGDRNNCAIATNSVTMLELCPFKPPMKVTWLDDERPAAIADNCESRRTKSLMLLICS
jgi:hypothetical protein